MAEDRTLPIEGTFLAQVNNLDEYASEKKMEIVGIDKANVVTSKVSSLKGDRHKVVLDIDVPAKLVPSSTPGHSHLCIDVEMEWEVYKEVLAVLAKAGVIEKGYEGASVSRGFTAVRLPWVKKRK